MEVTTQPKYQLARCIIMDLQLELLPYYYHSALMRNSLLYRLCWWLDCSWENCSFV